MQNIGVKEFWKRLQSEMQDIAKKRDWKFDSAQHRGYAFQLWCANVLCSYDQGIETEPEEALLLTGDLKADIVLEDPAQSHLVIAQCKYSSQSRRGHVQEAEVNDFFSRHSSFMDRHWVREHGSERAFEALGDYREKCEKDYTFSYYFMTTAEASSRIHELVARKNKEYRRETEITCYLYDFPALKDFYLRSMSLEESIPERVELKLPKERWFIKEDPHKTLVVVLKGNVLRQLLLEHKEALFAYNIRNYLGDRGINKVITETAEKRPKDFYYFNNGISAICTDFDIHDNNLIAYKFQVINGAQTIGALRRADANPDVEVLLRLTKSLGVSTEKGFNEEIILYNNSQNIIKISDFRANDPIQRWLEKKFKEITSDRLLVGPLSYVRKRGMKKGGRYSGRGLKLEDLAKIRYAYNIEPTTGLDSPKELWTLRKDGGKYEVSFGIEGILNDVWTDDEFEECLLAIAIYFKIEEETRHEDSDNPAVRIFKLRYHALSLAGLYLRHNHSASDRRKLLRNANAFDDTWKKFWPEVRRSLIDAFLLAQENNLTVRTFARNQTRWSTMKKKFTAIMKIPVS